LRRKDWKRKNTDKNAGRKQAKGSANEGEKAALKRGRERKKGRNYPLKVVAKRKGGLWPPSFVEKRKNVSRKKGPAFGGEGEKEVFCAGFSKKRSIRKGRKKKRKAGGHEGQKRKRKTCLRQARKRG